MSEMNKTTIIVLWSLFSIVGITGCSEESTGDILDLDAMKATTEGRAFYKNMLTAGCFFLIKSECYIFW